MSSQGKKITPMMERYLEVKREYPDSLLLFRMGDFYELFYEDAKIAARVLGLTLTSRDKGSPDPIPMAGFPYHALDSYLQKLIRAGYRAAICEQVEDPKKAKGLVRRDVVQVVTPGTLTDESLLDPREKNYLACVYADSDVLGLAWIEVSSGQFQTTQVEPGLLGDELARIQPAECLYAEGQAKDRRLQPLLLNDALPVTARPDWHFDREEAQRVLCEHFGVHTLSGFGLEDRSAAVVAAGALMKYVQETQKSTLPHIARLDPYRSDQTLFIDETTRASLELTRTIRGGSREGSLLWVLDHTVTPMGARLLFEWLSSPLTDIAAIERRLDAVQELVDDSGLCRELREQLKGAYDLERLSARLATRRASPRDLRCLADTLSLLPKLKAKLAARRSELLQQLEAELDLCPEIRRAIDAALVESPPVLISEGGLIRSGYNAELDELRELARGGKEWIARYQAKEVRRTGIPNLRVGFNKVFGYYLEVTSSQVDKVPQDYIRKQTLKNLERFVTPELKEYEEKVLRAEERAKELEQELFCELRERVAQQCLRVKQTASVLAQIDVLCSLAVLAVRYNYCRPELTYEPVLEIREGRHPVLDRMKPSGEFVPNDTLLNEEKGRVHIITGPNMAGKSTYIRQAALITILAQMGSFVPAAKARVGIADRIFARVGASDELGKGQSTFMVEMTETARILHGATERSLVILDEIGRGTSTYDGISLAWAVTEYLHDQIGCRTLFATHYHELTALPTTLASASNWNVRVQEQDDRIVFLHKIAPGPADKSYGIYVAQLAGVPPSVIQRAKVILKTLEQDHLDERGQLTIPQRRTRRKERQLLLFGPEDHPLLEEIRRLDVDRMTPLDALQKLHQMRQQLNDNSGRDGSKSKEPSSR